MNPRAEGDRVKNDNLPSKIPCGLEAVVNSSSVFVNGTLNGFTVPLDDSPRLAGFRPLLRLTINHLTSDDLAIIGLPSTKPVPPTVCSSKYDCGSQRKDAHHGIEQQNAASPR